MNAKDTSGLFETTRKAPVELSRESVLEFIKVIPTLPPPSTNWFQNFNLNSIIMTTTAITLVTSAVLYFSSPTEQDAKLEPIAPSTTTHPALILDSLESSPAIDSKVNRTTIQIDGIKEVISVETVTKVEPLVSKEIIATEEDKTIEPSEGSKENYKVTEYNSNRANTWSEYNNPKPAIDDRVSLNEDQLKSLKQTIEKYVKEDELNRGRSSLITIRFDLDSININNQLLTTDQKLRYKNLLKSYWISPGAERHIIINRKYIMAGDFNNNGFSGSALGNAMEVIFKEGPATIMNVSSNGDTTNSRKVNLYQMDINPIDAPKRHGGYMVQEFDSNDGKAKLSTSQLRSLKRQLLKLLKQDKLEKSGIASFSTLLYTAEYLQLNDTKLKGDMRTKYVSVLKSFNITPGPDRRVVVDDDFIQVGDYTEDGFDGQALGKNMEIYFIEGDDKGLFSKGTENKSFLNQDRADDTILKTEGKLKDSRVNLSKVDRLLRSQSNSEPKDGNRFYDSGNQAISIFNKETEDTYVELNSKQIRSLKKELYRELQRDKLIENRKADVRLLFSDNGILVNGLILTETLTFRYQRILDQYGVKAAENRKVLMSTDFIVVGDFVNSEFNGSLQGSLNSEDLYESVFKQDFAEFPVFGFDKAMKRD